MGIDFETEGLDSHKVPIYIWKDNPTRCEQIKIVKKTTGPIYDPPRKKYKKIKL